jgi:GNAT superfamily N-acetyltransferase
MIAIRTYQPEDALACMALFDSNLPKFFTTPEREQFAAFLARMDCPFYVAVADGQIRGCGGFFVDDYGVTYLVWGMIHSAWHRQGIGAQLLQWRLDQIRQVPHAWCVLIDTSQHSAPFFARFGFKCYRLIPDGYQAGLDKVFMRLLLPAAFEETEVGQ